MNVYVITMSDRCSRGEAEDRGGPAVAKAVEDAGWLVCGSEVLSDERDALSKRLRDLCDGKEAPDLIVTTGGTGIAPRDVTPEATRDVLDKELPGFAERMRREGEKSTPLALLSRAVCGARKKTLILNLPGSPKGAVESFESVRGLLPHASRILEGADHG
jgi:molybdenum cofactor synthesis domain-containing protein